MLVSLVPMRQGLGRNAERISLGDVFDPAALGWTEADVALALARKQVKPAPKPKPAKKKKAKPAEAAEPKE